MFATNFYISPYIHICPAKDNDDDEKKTCLDLQMQILGDQALQIVVVYTLPDESEGSSEDVKQQCEAGLLLVHSIIYTLRIMPVRSHYGQIGRAVLDKWFKGSSA
ncbi:hypothetical protein EV182_005784, partial [Spiromyces aspiralis]